ncbi:hypothetical protein D3C86_1735860 [compost metagenome]
MLIPNFYKPLLYVIVQVGEVHELFGQRVCLALKMNEIETSGYIQAFYINDPQIAV